MAEGHEASHEDPAVVEKSNQMHRKALCIYCKSEYVYHRGASN